MWVNEPVGGIQNTLESLGDLFIVRDGFYVYLCGCRGELFFGGAVTFCASPALPTGSCAMTVDVSTQYTEPSNAVLRNRL